MNDFASFALAANLAKASPESRSSRKARMKAYRDERIAKRAARLLEVTTAPETCRNHRLQARRLTDFARARMDWHSSLQCAQAWNVPGSSEYPKHDEGEGRFDLVHAWRAALMKQMLTPAPDVGAVNWKRVQFRGGQHRFTTVKPKRLQRAIDADVEWLNAHPSRKSIAASRQTKKGN